MPAIRRLPALLIVVCVIFALPWGNRAQGQNANPGGLTRTPALVAAPNGNQFDLESAPVPEVIDLLGQLTGKHFIRDTNLVGVPPVSVNGTGLTKEEFTKLITGTLLLNGIALIPVDDQTMKVVTVETNKNPRSEGVRYYSNEADLPLDDQIVTYYMPLDHIRPEEAAGIFTQVAPVHSYGAYVSATSANAIILTENVSVIRELIALKKGIDIQGATPLRPPPAPSSQPPPPGNHPPRGGLVILAVVVALASALGNFLAHLWQGRNKTRPTT
jgi:type II secretory pathway component GspD/PulD (secretin)